MEGFESAVFAGARETLSIDRPKLIMFESLQGRIEPAIQGCLKDADYTTFQLDSRGAADCSGADEQNLLAAPREILADIVRN